MKSINGSFIIHLDGSSIKSLLSKPHQPGQVLLPLDTLPSAMVIRHFFPVTSGMDNEGQLAMSAGQTPLLQEGVEPTSRMAKAIASRIPSQLS